MTEEDRYDGATNEDGEPHGHGNFRYRNGDRYEGGWKDGRRYGHGILECANGQRYEGGWKDGEAHGFGKWEQPIPKEAPSDFHRFFHEGGWKDGHRHGYGISIVWEGEEQKFYRKEGSFNLNYEKDTMVFDGVTCQVKYQNGEWVDVPDPTSYPVVSQSSTSSNNDSQRCKMGGGLFFSECLSDTCEECGDPDYCSMHCYECNADLDEC